MRQRLCSGAALRKRAKLVRTSIGAAASAAMLVTMHLAAVSATPTHAINSISWDKVRSRRQTYLMAIRTSGILVRPAGSSFRGLGADGNQPRGPWIERRWVPVPDLDDCASREWSGRASRRSRVGGTH